MIERIISRDAVMAYTLWAVTVLTFICAGVVLAHDHLAWGVFLAEVACGISAFAAVMHIRFYAVRACELIRNIVRPCEPEPTLNVPLQRVH